MARHSALRTQLEERLHTILTRVSRIERDLRQDHDRDWEERANELENDDVLEELDELARAEVRQLREALRRIDAGHYGFCVTCKSPIGEDRLEAMPSVTTCRNCAR